MLYIKKYPEPAALTQAKRDGLKDYSDMPTNVKDKIKEQLAAEQDINDDLHNTLNLNCDAAYLPANRKAALDGLKRKIYKDYGTKTAPQSYYQKLYTALSQMTSGEFHVYLGILLDYLIKHGAVPAHN